MEKVHYSLHFFYGYDNQDTYKTKLYFFDTRKHTEKEV